MDISSRKFYKSKLRIFLAMLLCILAVVSLFYINRNTSLPADTRMIALISAVIIAFAPISLIPSLFSNKPYIEITSLYIKISNFDRVLWNDIIDIKKFENRGTVVGWEVVVKDVSKYNLTLDQKINFKSGSAPFRIAFSLLNTKDQNDLKRILKEHFPDCDLD